MTVDGYAVQQADAYCARLVRHYENFTVASRLTPPRLRRDLMRVYAFCRTTDDLGDESISRDVALDALEAWRAETMAMFAGEQPRHPALLALQQTVRHRVLSPQPFLDLIDANVRDQTTTQYGDWPALLSYCRLSAAPVGRIVLQLFGVSSPAAVALSDDVCIGLQLANFAQDVRIDAQKGRTYLLQDELRRFGETGAVRAMCMRARDLLSSGRTLELMVRGRLRLQLRLYRLGGEAILDAVAASGFRTAQVRPVVSGMDRLRILRRLFVAGHTSARGSFATAPAYRAAVEERRG